MRKSLITIGIIIGLLWVSLFISNKIGFFSIYTNNTVANEPNQKLNSKVFVSNLKKPKIGDFVLYKHEDEMFGKGIRIHRLCGMENDTVEIRNGILYINGEHFDQNIDLIHFYKLSNTEFEIYRNSDAINENSLPIPVNSDSLIVLFSDSFANKNNLYSRKMIDSEGKTDTFIKNIFNEDWNKDNFGPLIIPKNKIFVLGDNRHNSEDSRYIGLIDNEDIVGTVLK